MQPFNYPHTVHVRRHGPFGYTDYESYRDWLRDEFSFRCVFCLLREQWWIVKATFHVDHWIPQSVDPQRVCDYDNLLYACARCNTVKDNLLVPNPCKFAFGQCVRVHKDGRIEALNQEGAVLIDCLRLDDEDCTRYRKLMIDDIHLARKKPDLFRELMGYPEKLPDLSRRRPPGNLRPKGIEQSFFAMRERGELPDVY